MPEGLGGHVVRFLAAKFPAPERAGVGDGAGEAKVHAECLGLKAAEFPLVAGQKFQLAVDLLHCEFLGPRIGAPHGKDDPTVAQGHALDVQLQMTQRRPAQMHLGLRGGGTRTVGLTGATELDTVGHHAAREVETHPVEPQLDAALAQFEHQPVLHETRQSEVMEPQDEHEEREQAEPDHDAAPAKGDARDAPEPAARFGERAFHVVCPRRPAGRDDNEDRSTKGGIA